jgi:hypothetical protein
MRDLVIADRRPQRWLSLDVVVTTLTFPKLLLDRLQRFFDAWVLLGCPVTPRRWGRYY